MLMNRLINIILLATLLLLPCCGGDVSTKSDLKPEMEKNTGGTPSDGGYLASDPGSDKSPGKLGFWYLKTGRLDKAIDEFKAALQKEPGDPFSTYYLGLAYLNKEDFDKAAEVWKGYRNKANPEVEEEIERHLTIIQIARSKKFAAKAIAEEKKLAAVSPERNTVAVCYYQDLSPDNSLRAFQKGLAAMVITDLTKIKSIRVVERIRLQALLDEMKLGQTGYVNSKTAPRLGRLLGAQNIVFGSLAQGSIKATTSLAASDKPDIVGSSSVSVDKEKFFELPMAIVRDTVNIMGVVLTDDEKKAIGAPHTKVYKALEYYGKALDALDAGKWKEASEFFNMAHREDPGFGLAKEGADTCPGPDAPNVNSLSGISGNRLSAGIETAVRAAEGSKRVVHNAPNIMPLNGFTGGINPGYDTGGVDLGGVGNLTVTPPTGGNPQLPGYSPPAY
jgi:tetratricopeptide (TPR) repeat protein